MKTLAGFLAVLAWGLLFGVTGIRTTLATPVVWETDFGDEVTSLTGEDDATDSVSLSFEFPFLDDFYSDIAISTNGQIGLGTSTPDTYDPSESDLYDAGQPIIAPFWTDLDLGSMGEIDVNDFGDRVVVTWNNVGSYENEDAPFTFQVQLLEDGTIIFAFNGISSIVDDLSEDIIIGISPGDGFDPGSIDYTADAPFTGGDTIYEYIAYGDEPFDLDQATITFTPAGSFDVTVEFPEQIPEPGTLALLGFGLAGIGAMRRRKRKA